MISSLATKIRKSSHVIMTALLLFPASVSAHERWFVSESAREAFQAPFSWGAMQTVLAVGAAAFFFLLLFLNVFISKKNLFARPRALLAKFSGWSPLLLRSLTGLLLFFAGLSRFLFAPDIQTLQQPRFSEQLFLSGELMIGLAFAIGFMPRLASALGLVLFTAALFLFPFSAVAPYLFFPGIFAYLLLKSDPNLPKTLLRPLFASTIAALNLKAAEPFAMPLLRIFTGGALVAAAILYKIWDPSYALAFVAVNPCNFLRALGVSNELFVLSAGLTEAIIGISIMLGVLPRFFGGLLIFMFTLTLGYFGVGELVGHLPLYAVAFALLFEGAGKRWLIKA